MVMGPQLEQIASSAADPYAAELEREQLRKARLAKIEKWKEFYALLFAFAAFSVPPDTLHPSHHNSPLIPFPLTQTFLTSGVLVGGGGDI